MTSPRPNSPRPRLRLSVWLGRRPRWRPRPASRPGRCLSRRRAVRAPPGAAAPAHSDLHYNFLGYADLEQGVTPLYPLRPGRVVKVFVHDGDAVDEGRAAVR